MARVFKSFKEIVTKHRLLANCVTYGTLYAGSEFSQQYIISILDPKKGQKIEWGTIARYGVLGSTIYPVGLYYWYNWLDKAIVGKTVKMIVKKVVVDHLVTMPLMIYIFYVGMNMMEGKSDVYSELKEKFWSTFCASSAFWMPVQGINFMLIPSSMRIAFVATTSFGWVNLLCVLKRMVTGLEDETKQKIED